MTFLTTLIFIGAISAAEVTTARTDATVDKIMAQLATSERIWTLALASCACAPQLARDANANHPNCFICIMKFASFEIYLSIRM